jgi:hypothetical protein
MIRRKKWNILERPFHPRLIWGNANSSTSKQMFSPSPQIRSKDVHNSGENMCFYVFLWRIYRQYNNTPWIHGIEWRSKLLDGPIFWTDKATRKFFCIAIVQQSEISTIAIQPKDQQIALSCFLRDVPLSAGKSRPKSDPSVRVFESEKYWKILKNIENKVWSCEDVSFSVHISQQKSCGQTTLSRPRGNVCSGVIGADRLRVE